jgi:hypothetical protein
VAPILPCLPARLWLFIALGALATVRAAIGFAFPSLLGRLAFLHVTGVVLPVVLILALACIAVPKRRRRPA